jgi:hypothetical protein
MAKLLECIEPDGKLMSTSNMPELFRPCSPIKHSSTPMIFASLTEACTHVESQVCKDPSGSITDEIIPTSHIVETSDVENHGEMNSGINELFVDQTIEVSTGTCTSQVGLQLVDPVGDVVLVENTSKDKPLSNAYVTNENEDPTFLITVEEDSTGPTSQVNGGKCSTF